MGRAPCCEKMGLKKGCWTKEEDQLLIDYINLHGHSNWRALPKQAGLLRCGKSCRLRWINYLRPGIKRGNFTPEEEDTIIKLHQALGSRWSAIAARLPGRTDNEIKNVWHARLKKRLSSRPEIKTESSETSRVDGDALELSPNSPPHSSTVSSHASAASSTTSASSGISNECGELDELLEYSLPEADESFWSEVFAAGNSSEFSTGDDCGFQFEHRWSSDFWDELFTEAA